MTTSYVSNLILPILFGLCFEYVHMLSKVKEKVASSYFYPTN